LKISFQEAFIVISRFKEALQKFGEEIRQSILHSSDEILEQSQPRPVVGIMLQCSANAARTAHLTISNIGNSRIAGLFDVFPP
jgi:hypothetical protein